MNNFDNNISCLSGVFTQTDDRVSFGGQKFALYWTLHAKKRITERGASELTLATHFLRFALEYAEENLQEELKNLNECTLFDRVSDVFAVLKINRNNQKIYVISYGDASVMYPRVGDTVIQHNESGQIRLITWEYKVDSPVLSGVYCELNGRILQFRWTRKTVKAGTKAEIRKANYKKLCAIGEALSCSLQEIPENEPVNIWDWRTGTFASIKMQPDKNTLDVILFRTVDFVTETNQYARIDITVDNRCVFQPVVGS